MDLFPQFVQLGIAGATLLVFLLLMRMAMEKVAVPVVRQFIASLERWNAQADAFQASLERLHNAQNRMCATMDTMYGEIAEHMKRDEQTDREVVKAVSGMADAIERVGDSLSRVLEVSTKTHDTLHNHRQQ